MNNHTEKEQNVITAYQNAVDKDIEAYVIDVMNGRDVIPLTVGFINEAMNAEINELTGLSVYGNRIVLGPDDVRHILNRHGPQGRADHSMKDISDIARLSYVISNYDSIEWDGGRSKLYRTKDGLNAPQIVLKKRVDGMYYVVEVVSDSKKKRNIVSSIYLKKALN